MFVGSGPVDRAAADAAGIGTIAHMDLAARRLPAVGQRFVADEERLPLAPASVNLIVSILTMHQTNDLDGALSQMRMALKPDGLLIAVMFAEETLGGLRAALHRAEAELTGGVSPRWTR